MSSIFNLSRDVSTGATNTTAVVPKFSDTLTLYPTMGGRFCPPSQRLYLKFSRGYVPVIDKIHV